MLSTTQLSSLNTRPLLRYSSANTGQPVRSSTSINPPPPRGFQQPAELPPAGGPSSKRPTGEVRYFIEALTAPSDPNQLVIVNIGTRGMVPTIPQAPRPSFSPPLTVENQYRPQAGMGSRILGSAIIHHPPGGRGQVIMGPDSTSTSASNEVEHSRLCLLETSTAGDNQAASGLSTIKTKLPTRSPKRQVIWTPM